MYNIRVSYIENVGPNGNNLNTDNIDNYQNEINEFNVFNVQFDNNKLLLTGEVKERVFNITGIPKLLNYNGNVIYFECRDTLDNYTILNISLEKNIEESAFYHKGFASNKNFDNILKIYLQPKGSNDVAILEYFNSPLIEVFQLSDSITGEYDENAELKFKYWYGRILEPVASEVITPMGYDNNIGTYVYEFNHLGETYYHNLEIARNVEWANVSESGSTFTANLYVNRNYVTTEYGNEMSDVSSYYEIDDVAIEFAVDAGDGINSVVTDGDVYNESDVDITLTFNELPIGSIGSVGVNYTSPEYHFDINDDAQIFQNGPTEFVKEARVEMPSNSKLKIDDNYFASNWLVKNYNGLNNGSQTAKFKFYYYITNLWDYMDPYYGPRTFTETKTYYSEP